MADIRRCGSVRDRAFAGLIREEAALHTREDGGAEAAANRSLRREGIVEDERKHRGNL